MGKPWGNLAIKNKRKFELKKALVCGVTGQDGAYLAKHLLEKGYDVYGASRDSFSANLNRLKVLGVEKAVSIVSLNITDFRSVLQNILKIKPDEVYNLAGQSSVGLSFEQPVETLESIVIGTLNILEAIRFSGLDIKFYSAGSSECFGDTGDLIADEKTPFRPKSPYGVAKSTAYWEVANYREAYGMSACTGILFNHESPLRPKRFVTQKIIAEVIEVNQGKRKQLKLGNINIERDWGWAPEYVEAMWLMLQGDKCDDFVIATGETRSLKEFIQGVFKCFNLNWEEFTEIDRTLFRPSDIQSNRGNPEKAKRLLNWEAQTKFDKIIELMVEGYLNGL